MSFTFGQSTTTTSGPTFGTNTLSGGTLFGGGDSKAFQSPGLDNKVNFFSSPTTTTPAFGGFAFGAKTTAATTGIFSSPVTTAGSSSFGAAKPITFGGFTSPPNQTVGSPGFGQTPTQNAPQNLSFGQPPTLQQAAPAPTFGSATSQATFGGAANSSFSLAKPATTSVYAFTPTSGFSLPQQAAATTAQPTQANFSLTPTTTSAGGFMQSAPPFSQMFAKSSFSLTPIASTTTTVAATTAAPTITPVATSSFGFSQQASTFSLPQSTATTAVASGFSFGPATSFPSSQPQATQAQPLSFTLQTQATSQPAPAPLGYGLNMNLLSKPPATGLVGQASQQSHASLVSQAGQVSQSGLISQAGQIGQIGQVSQAGLQSVGLTGFPTSSTAQTAKLNFGVTTSAVTSQITAPATSALSFSAATTGGLTFTASSLPTSVLSFSKTSVTSSSTTTTTGTVTAASTTIISLGKSTAAPTMATLSTTTTTTPSGLPQPITSITFTQLEENINKWTLELEEQEKIFINQATQINAWDRLLIANGEIILELNDTIQTVKNEQQSLEHELDFVLAQQKELEEVIAPMEKQLLNETGDRMRDPEREHMYSLAENLDTQLRQMSEDLKEVIEHLNETNRSQDTNDPIVQIGRILNAHMSSMQWIDNSIVQISTRLDQLKATHDTLRRDNERSFQLTYN